MNIKDLQSRFSIDGQAAIVAGANGLTSVCVTTPQCEGELYLLGGQITRWKPSGHQEVLWLSQQSQYKVGKAIRGGIPVCFPWFGAKSNDPKAPSHGFVRTRQWDLESIHSDNEEVTVTVLTRDDETSKEFWPVDYELRLRARFGAQLTLQLEFANKGKQSVRFEEALHAYFTVSDVRQASISGLDKTGYLDKTAGNARETQTSDIRFNSETDRVYLDTTHDVTINDPVLTRRIRIQKQNSRNTVIWNPWIDKARTLSDFGDDEWTNMVCVEPSNVGVNSIEVSPGQQHTMQLTLSSIPL